MYSKGAAGCKGSERMCWSVGHLKVLAWSRGSQKWAQGDRAGTFVGT